jgi:hypothetical protein
MLSRILLVSGILMIVASFIGVALSLHSSFASLHTNESAGIGAVGDGIYFALISTIAFFVGLGLLIGGVIKLILEKRSKS